MYGRKIQIQANLFLLIVILMTLPPPQDAVFAIQAGISLYYSYIYAMGLLRQPSWMGKSQVFFPSRRKPTLASHQSAPTASVQTRQQATAHYSSATVSH